MNSKIRQTLNRIGAISENRVVQFSPQTRDIPNLQVFRDSESKVIFIDDYYAGDIEYINGKYKNFLIDYEDATDTDRRFNSYRQFITAKDICDFGCGSGSFLKRSQSVAKNIYGIELQQNYINDLIEYDIECYPSINKIEMKLDVVTLFHCLEHLPDPSSTLKQIHTKLKHDGNGILIVEVPHAKDFLIDFLDVKEFINFTLWSQHLILHTRESLRLLLSDAGFKNIIIDGVQRYSIANHFYWLKNKKPGGHKSIMSLLETPDLISSYRNALVKLDMTDTLVAFATT